MNEEIQVTEQEQGLEESKTYTESEVLALLQSEADKRVQQALKTQQKKFDKELAKQKSLSQLDAQQREQAEKDMKIQELEEKLKEFNVMQTRNEITKVLSARGLNVQFADLINISDDIEEAQQRIDLLDKLFKAEVKAEVERRINTSVPQMSTIGLDNTITKEQFYKMNIAEQTSLYKNNPELYAQLTK